MAILEKFEQEKIDKAVDGILLQTNMSYPNDSLLDIVKALNIQVKTADFGKYIHKVSGAVRRKPAIIYLNETHPKERQTFTLAHELGHFVLRHGGGLKLRVDKYNYYTNTKEAKEETEANYFAATLLMPKVEFLSVLEKAGSIPEIAKYFGVSGSAVINRMRWLEQN